MITVKINGKKVPMDTIRVWEKKRFRHSSRFLTGRHGHTHTIRSAQDLLAYRVELSEHEMRKSLRHILPITALLTKIAAKVSRGKRKLSVTELMVTDCSAGHLSAEFHALMLNNTPKNRQNCLAACPDHYLLKSRGNQVQEVIEAAAGMPLPLQFFVTYGDESSLTTSANKDFPYQAAGTARLIDGTVIGGVRHQMKDMDGSCAVQLTVEFPSLIPDRYIREHQLHLACEFYHWFSICMPDITI